MSKPGLIFILSMGCICEPFTVTAQQEIGHYSPGVMNIRDYVMPEPGFYGVVYNYFYNSSRLNDAQGNKISSVNIKAGPGQGVNLNVNVKLNAYALAPAFIWVSKWKILGATYGAYLSPVFSNTSVAASLSTVTGSGRNAAGSQFGIADPFVQPLWLGWKKKYFDISFGYGLYIPVGKYNTEILNFPVIGQKTVEAANNIGLGFWTNQFQTGVSYYPWSDKRMAIATALTYEVHSKKKDFDLTPGQNLSFNWGISEYLPIKKDQTLLLEIGPAGYSSWQVSDDKGSDAGKPLVRDQVHAIGGQAGLTFIPWNAVINFHYFYEISSRSRFQGEVWGVNLAIKI